LSLTFFLLFLCFFDRRTPYFFIGSDIRAVNPGIDISTIDCVSRRGLCHRNSAEERPLMKKGKRRRIEEYLYTFLILSFPFTIALFRRGLSLLNAQSANAPCPPPRRSPQLFLCNSHSRHFRNFMIQRAVRLSSLSRNLYEFVLHFHTARLLHGKWKERVKKESPGDVARNGFSFTVVNDLFLFFGLTLCL